MLPPIPSWDGLHPIIVHFPIALLLVAPVLILLGMFFGKNNRAFMLSAFILMVIGTIATFIAVSTGESAGELAERLVNAESILENHEELAETTRTVFTALTIIFGAIIVVPLILKKELGKKILIPISCAFLVFYSAGAVLLINTAHQGGRLVHEFGVRAMMANSNQNGTNNQNLPESRRGDGDDD
ncbi:MAG: hypothetical protein K1X72_13950 [Pyrinomonadaceae bacterium]|nr:hypothetical protein [Pyrinomonadaceae bacterium]